MKTNIKALSIVILAAAAVAVQADQFKFTITNTGPQPLSPIFVSTSNNQFNLFSVGAPASYGIKRVAEGGDTSGLLDIAGSSAGVAWSGVLGNAPLAPGASRTFTITADAAHPFVSFAAMLGKTNDGFIGESVNSMGLNLYGENFRHRLDLVIRGDRAWDAGTEKNTQSSADLGFAGGSGNTSEDPWDAHVRVHSGVLAGIGDSWALMPNWTYSTEIARITIMPVSGR